MEILPGFLQEFAQFFEGFYQLVPSLSSLDHARPIF